MSRPSATYEPLEPRGITFRKPGVASGFRTSRANVGRSPNAGVTAPTPVRLHRCDCTGSDQPRCGCRFSPGFSTPVRFRAGRSLVVVAVLVRRRGAALDVVAVLLVEAE